MSEHHEQCKFILWCRRNEKKYPPLTMIFANPNGGKRDLGTAINLKKEGVKAGLFDISLFYPSKQYHGMFIEMKFGSNKLSPYQKIFKVMAEKVGYYCVVCYSSDEAINKTLEYLDIKKGGERL
jgi:hypothetical protein